MSLVLKTLLNRISATRSIGLNRNPALLAPISSGLNSLDWTVIRGLKHVQNPHRRCKHCYTVYEDERKYIFCDKYPRHKQVSLAPVRIRQAGRILTHATQGGRGHMQMWTQQGMRADY